MVRFNSEWLSKLNFEDVIKLVATSTVARMLERMIFRTVIRMVFPLEFMNFFTR